MSFVFGKGKKFQSTRPYRARHADTNRSGLFVKVSIHAPVQGATVLVVSLTVDITGFNPRARTGRDL